jgi:hypothetical protein
MIYHDNTRRKKEKIIHIAELLFHIGKLRRKICHLTEFMEYDNPINILIYLSQ